jgi:hypothetical protein
LHVAAEVNKFRADGIALPNLSILKYMRTAIRAPLELIHLSPQNHGSLIRAVGVRSAMLL